ncbi:NAD-dependent epimerase/dehydratase family protein [Cupriavidus sp. 2TAF22]|uniref:NAD-dependent epimerase/dehydratase family protein n=1 Tax=unclassified Cupriavidus TaxID=2640874 RepID=UPI003F8F86FA
MEEIGDGNCAVIFGGNGFIGAFLAYSLASSKKYRKVYLFDRESIEEKQNQFRLEMVRSSGAIELLGDVRHPITWAPDERVDFVANLAAVHREPGHLPHEYYETNILGAENVCDWARRVNATNIIFTSSIAPYGVSDERRDENSLPVPASAYGGSKLVAEKIHLSWLNEDRSQRVLTIVRPGVVFGPGESGNVSRLIHAVMRRYFFYMGNKETRKAGVYVKELVDAMQWVHQQQIDSKDAYALFNMSMEPAPAIRDYVNAVCLTAGIKRHVPEVPFSLLLLASHSISLLAGLIGLKQPFSPVRVRKLVRPNYITPGYLLASGYSFKYDLAGAFQDWQTLCPDDWK